jgi:hypothetical protein
MLASAGQAFLLLIPSIGLGYTLIALGRRFTTALWTWGKPNAVRRAISGVCYVGALGLLGFMWLPQLPLPGRAQQPAPINLGPMSPVSWQPIGADERGTLQDVVSDAIAPAVLPTVEPRQAQATAQPTPGQTVQPAAPPVTDVQTRGTPEPTPAATAGATPGVSQATSQAVAPTPETALQATPLPRSTLTPTPSSRATPTIPPRVTPTPRA